MSTALLSKTQSSAAYRAAVLFNMYSSAEVRDKPGIGGKIPRVAKLLDQVREVLAHGSSVRFLSPRRETSERQLRLSYRSTLV